MFGILFVLFWSIHRQIKTWKQLLLLGLLFRLVFICATPNLSQDFYRYLWDGNLMGMGINPYLHTPKEVVELVQFPFSSVLYEKMGFLSNVNYSNYPPLSQYLFQGMAFFSQKNLFGGIIFLRFIYFMFEMLLFFLGKNLIKTLKLSPNLASWYFLNPLLIIETYGNLHGEGVMCGIFLLGLGFLFQKRVFFSALLFGISIAFKLFPLLFLPLFYFYFRRKRRLLFYGIITTTVFLFFLPFSNENTALNYWKTLNLWFNTFEFNASLFYLLRAIGFELVGFNIIKIVGLIMPFFLITSIGYISLRNRNPTDIQILKNLLWVCSLYLFTATTVHPWYVISLVALGLLSGYLFPLVWSATVFLSYTAYGSPEVEESAVALVLEYSIVYACLAYELWKKPLLKHFQKTDFFLR
ncbi:MAG: DUF2029 domain-containing protein [Flavobacteriaceae bacterium]|nr:DUF2029 domain-containing protein [Flavobacteriaceae bacterium]